MDLIKEARAEFTTSFSDIQRTVQRASARYGWRHGAFKIEDIAQMKKATQIGFDRSLDITRAALAKRLSEVTGSEITVKKPLIPRTLVANIMVAMGVIASGFSALAYLGLIAKTSFIFALASAVTASPYTTLAVIASLVVSGFILSNKRTATGAVFAAGSAMALVFIGFKALFMYFPVTSGLTAAAGKSVSVLLTPMVSLWSISPILVVAIATLGIAFTFTLTFTKLSALARVDDTARKTQELLMGIDSQPLWPATKTLLKFAFQEPLRLVSTMGSVASLFTIIGGLATGAPALIAVSVQWAGVLAVASLVSAVLIYAVNQRKIDNARPSTMSSIQRVYRSAAFMIIPVLAALLTIATSGLFDGGALSQVAIAIAGFVPIVLGTVAAQRAAFFSKDEVYQQIETYRGSISPRSVKGLFHWITRSPAAQRIIGSAAGLVALQVFLWLASQAAAQGSIATFITVATMAPFALMGVFYFAAIPVAIKIYGAAYKKTTGQPRYLAGAMVVGTGTATRLQSIFASGGSVIGAVFMLHKYIGEWAGPYSVAAEIGIGLAGLLLVAVYYEYNKLRLQQAAEGRAPPKFDQVLRDTVFNPQKVMKNLGVASSFAAGGGALGTTHNLVQVVQIQQLKNAADRADRNGEESEISAAYIEFYDAQKESIERQLERLKDRLRESGQLEELSRVRADMEKNPFLSMLLTKGIPEELRGALMPEGVAPEIEDILMLEGQVKKLEEGSQIYRQQAALEIIASGVAHKFNPRIAELRRSLVEAKESEDRARTNTAELALKEALLERAMSYQAEIAPKVRTEAEVAALRPQLTEVWYAFKHVARFWGLRSRRPAA